MSQSRFLSVRHPCPATHGQGDEDSGKGIGKIKALWPAIMSCAWADQIKLFSSPEPWLIGKKEQGLELSEASENERSADRWDQSKRWYEKLKIVSEDE